MLASGPFTLKNLRAAVATAASTLAVTVLGAGCGPAWSETTTSRSGSDTSTLTFEYSSCPFGCGLGRPALQGSTLTIAVKGGAANAKLSARLTGTPVGRIADQSYSCDSGACILSLTIETTHEGDAKLEAVDPTGNVVDAATLSVQPAASLEVNVDGRRYVADGGFHDVKQGDRLPVSTRALSADGKGLFFSRHGISQEYANKAIVGPGDGFVLFGETIVEDAIANTVGETTLTLRAGGAESVVRFRVTK